MWEWLKRVKVGDIVIVGDGTRGPSSGGAGAVTIGSLFAGIGGLEKGPSS